MENDEQQDLQELTIKVRFKVKHSPGSEEHLQNILYNYLKPKGITLITEGELTESCTTPVILV